MYIPINFLFLSNFTSSTTALYFSPVAISNSAIAFGKQSSIFPPGILRSVNLLMEAVIDGVK